MAERFDLIVIGTGAAGLATALGARGLRVAVLCKGVFGLDGNSCWAQSGMAGALSNADSSIQHAADTLAAGYKANNKMAVRWMIEEAPEVARWLQQLSVQWDRGAHGAILAPGAGHHTSRLLRAGGDSIGAEVMRAMRDAVTQANNIEVFEFCEVERLIKCNGAVVGAHARSRRQDAVELYAPSVVLATGGLGQLYRFTTNPSEATGGGIALAHAAGADMQDLEFVQFHPTALANRNQNEADQLPLMPEGLRAAGARLVNENGMRFLSGPAEHAELSQSDLLARALMQQMENGNNVYLDARSLGDSVRQRFPTAFAACQTRGFDLRLDLIPVMPAAHFHMGGVKVDMHSTTSVAGLYAVGEVACTGVHGANRLSGNALLEAIAFGRTLGERLSRQGKSAAVLRDDGSIPNRRMQPAPVSESLIYSRLRSLMWSFVGITRSGEGLQNALDQIELLEKRCLSGSKALDQLLTAKLITKAAAARTQSIGAHARFETASNGVASARSGSFRVA
jgi:L-aspartate oxidase